MSALTLKTLLRSKTGVSPVLKTLVEAMGGGAGFEDASGTSLIGEGSDGHSREPVTIEDETVGWVTGEPVAAGALASLLVYLLVREAERRALADEVLHLYREVNLMGQLSEQLAAVLDIDAICQCALDQACRLIPASNGGILVMDEAGGPLRSGAFFGMDHLGENAPPLSPESKFAVSVAQRGLGEIVNDYSSDPRAIDSELYLGSLICTPLRAKQRTVGVIALGNTDGKPYPASDLKLLNTIALQTAAAIENAMASQQILSREVERKALKLEAHQRLQQSERLEAALCEAERQKNLAESTLRNILPEKVAVELQTRGTVEPMYFEDVTIGFADFVGFTLSTEKLAAEEVVGLLHEYFTAFDRIMRRYGLEKLRTMGDGYMFVSGLPDRKPSHPVDAVLAALEMVETVRRMARPAENVDWQVRIGLHTGPVIAGVVGIHKFQFDIWGDPVNFASRMESSGAPNRVNLSERTYSRVKDFIRCTPRGPILTKDGREVEMFFADGVLRKLVDGNGVGTPPAFARRYRVYFNRDVCAFPDLRLTQSHEP